MALNHQNFDSAVSECLSATVTLVGEAQAFAEKLRAMASNPLGNEPDGLELQRVLVDEAHSRFVASSGLLFEQIKRS